MARDVAVGVGFTCALTRDYQPVCWGEDAAWLGPAPAHEYQFIDAGGGYVCGIEMDGSISCWTGSDVPEEIALTVSSAPSGSFQSLSVSLGGACALDLEGHAQCWSREGLAARTPTDVVFTALEVGNDGACGLLEDATILCFCDPEECTVNGWPEGAWEQLAVGRFHACVLGAEGIPHCWGNSMYTDPPEGVRFSTISAGWDYTCGVALDGEVVCWTTFFDDNSALDDEELWDHEPEGVFVDVEVEWSVGAAVTANRDIVDFGYTTGGSFQEAARTP